MQRDKAKLLHLRLEQKQQKIDKIFSSFPSVIWPKIHQRLN